MYFQRLKNKKETPDQNYEDLFPVCSTPDISYSLAEIHKAIKDGVSLFHPF